MASAPKTYLDQNALISLGEKCRSEPAFRTRLLRAVTDAEITIVLSAWHWVETARQTNIERAAALADFMDELRPVWLRDRRYLEKVEVESGFFSFVGVAYTPTPAMICRPELLSEMNRVQLSQETAPSSRAFVEGWIKKPELMEPILISCQKNVKAVMGLREAIDAGKLTAAHRKEGDRLLIQGFLPTETPNGITVGSETRASYLETASLQHFPTLAIEAQIAEHVWASEGQTGWNSMIDRFHLISALPYVDVIVSDDRYFSALLPIAMRTGFVKAHVLNFTDFCKAFLT